MWCLVSQPNANLVIEVRLGSKATGQECLNQVCKNRDNFQVFGKLFLQDYFCFYYV